MWDYVENLMYSFNIYLLKLIWIFIYNSLGCWKSIVMEMSFSCLCIFVMVHATEPIVAWIIYLMHLFYWNHCSILYHILLCFLPLFPVDLMKPDTTVILRNAKIDMFKGSMRLAVDKWGRIEVTEPADFVVRQNNNMSLVEYELVSVVEEWMAFLCS